MSEKRLTQALQNILANGNSLAQGDASNVILSAHYETEESVNPHIRGFFTLTSAFDLANLGQFSTKPYGDDIVSLSIQSRLKKWCKAISLLPSNLHYATSLQTLKSLSITCKRWSIVSCVHDSLLGHSSKRRECLSMKCVATNHSSF